MKKTTRLLALVLALVMLIGIVPAAVFAEDDGQTEDGTNGNEKDTDDLYLSKSLDDDANVLTLETYAKGVTVHTEKVESVPTDFVLLLDNSGSMKYKMNDTQSYTRIGYIYDPDDWACAYQGWTNYEEGEQGPDKNAFFYKMSFNNVSSADYSVIPAAGTAKEGGGRPDKGPAYYYWNGHYCEIKACKYAVNKDSFYYYLYFELDGQRYFINDSAANDRSSNYSYPDILGVYRADEASNNAVISGNVITVPPRGVLLDKGASTEAVNVPYAVYGSHVIYWGPIFSHWIPISGPSYKQGGEVKLTKIHVLKKAVKNFIELIKADEIENDSTHKIAMVKFSEEHKGNTYDSDIGVSYKTSGTENTRATDSMRGVYSPTQIVSGFVDAAANAAELENRVNLFVEDNYYGSTYIDDAFELAETVIGDGTQTEKRNLAVVVFTDGKPESSSGGGEFAEGLANTAVGVANRIKALEKEGCYDQVRIYSIGMNDAAEIEKDGTKIGNFMNRISSNYDATATAYNAGGNQIADKYYITVEDEADLESVFSKIAEEETEYKTVSLNEETELRDYMSDYFEIDPGAASDRLIHVYSVDRVKNTDGTFGWATESNGDDAYFKIAIDGIGYGDVTELTPVKPDGSEMGENETYIYGVVPISHSKDDGHNRGVSVTGFDYAACFVEDKDGRTKDDQPYYGSKLVVEIPVAYNGDNNESQSDEQISYGDDNKCNIKTNRDDSGIYDEDEPIIDIPSPEKVYEYFTVYHQSDMENPSYVLTEDLPDDGLFDVTRIFHPKYVVGEEDLNSADFPWNRYYGMPVGYLYGGMYTGGENVGECDFTEPLTEDGKAICGLTLHPQAGDVYYVKDVPEYFMAPRTLNIYTGAGETTHFYFLSAIDKLIAEGAETINYLDVGFDYKWDEADEEYKKTMHKGDAKNADDHEENYTEWALAESVSVYRANGTDTPDLDASYVAHDVTKSFSSDSIKGLINADIQSQMKDIPSAYLKDEGTKRDGLVICHAFNDEEFIKLTRSNYSEENAAIGDFVVKYRPYYVTPDNVKVTGAYERTLTFPSANWGYEDFDNTDVRCGSVVINQNKQQDPPADKAKMMVFRTSAALLAEKPIEKINVTTVVDGGETAFKFEKGDLTGKLEAPVKTGYLFAGWYLDAGFKTPADFSDVQSDITVYARFVREDSISFTTISVGLINKTYRTSVRMNTGDYQEVGFVYSIGNRSGVAEMKKERSLLGTTTYTGTWSGGSVALNTKATIQLYWVTADGTVVYGTAQNYDCRLGTLVKSR